LITRRPFAVFAEAFQMKSTKAMIKLISLLTFALVLGAVAVGLLSPPATDALSAHEDVTPGCPLSPVALDEGYGVTRMEMRPVCPKQ
jgi:hypothetical protein